ncbi:MAG: hypothetical protein IRY99_05955 [Isosphaeraceae bacterium]|nr:hypothetical protein [Isosphaeraceae bacterium]
MSRSKLVFGLAALVIGSCGRDDGRLPVYPVEGQVLHRGQPAEGALIVFHPLDNPDPEASRPNGRVVADGSFRLGTYEAEDGAPAGRYAVTVFWPGAPSGPDADPDLQPDRLRGRYGNPHASPWQVQVREGPNELEPFQLR